MKFKFSTRALLLVVVFVAGIVWIGNVIVKSVPYSSTYEETFDITFFPDESDDELEQWLSKVDGVNRVVVSRSSDGQLTITYLVVQRLGQDNALPEIKEKLHDLGYEIEPPP